MPTVATAPSFVVSMQQVTLYQKGYKTLHSVDFQLAHQEYAFLYGATGSGKSSLLQTIYAHTPLREGLAQVLGFDLKAISPDQIAHLRRQIGIITPDYPLLPHLSIEDNLLFVLEITDWADTAQRQQRCEQVLEQLQLQAISRRRPNEVTKTDYVRAQIARAVLNHPLLLLLDAPTAPLDFSAQESLRTLIQEQAQQLRAAVLWATNDLRLVPDAASRWDCLQGRLVQAQ